MKKIILFIIIILSFKAEAQNVSALNISQKTDSLYSLAKANEAIGNVSKALYYYEKANSEGKENKSLKFDYAKLLAQASKFEKADSILKKLIIQFPNNPNYLYQRVLLKEAQNDSTAIEAYQKVYLLDSNHINSLYKIARYYIENRKFIEAEPFIDKGLAKDSSSVRFLYLLALKQFYTKECHNAISTYTKLIGHGESNIQIHENLASCYAYTNQFEKSLDQYRLLFEKFDDQNPKWHIEAAKRYRSLNDAENSEHHFNIAIGLQEIPLAESYLEMAKLYKWKRDYKDEMKALKSALINNPNNEMALYSLAVAADNYFADKEVVLHYYEDYLKKYSETGRMRELAKQRANDLIKELHFSKD
ncbi:tetratricopeptide repeat protein [Aequorivita sp. F47161]|uniref:Tetratricopeptide repeat protein n=1 Tax=Aequorivita vitellina TaxID=2874475 RepID=A0A9X1QY39_9FLAO|nr:tetratricopeptide repeat protein [Aequorivita vitellina]MCG2419904.1 tetratricopeptide repeat protein [Aequorivita vitellina]